MLRRWLGNGLWTLGNLRHALAYRRTLADPRASQERLLFSFLRRNAASAYGRAHRYAEIRSVEQFQTVVPIVRYEDLEPWIERICDGEPNVLTTEPVLLLEKTSGSSRAAKYIPYTASLLREFRRAVGAWMHDLFTHRPALLGGAHYWSLTPVARPEERSRGGVPVGLADDTDYFGPWDRWLLHAVLAVPGSVARARNLEESRELTLRWLMRSSDLRFISVWNPSFLTLLLGGLPRGARPRDLWPELRLISCWTSGASARFLPELQDLFPDVEIQGKGLLATEGVVSVPMYGPATGSGTESEATAAALPALATSSHFLEFVDRRGRACLADELRVGERYSVLMTTGSGFARYELGDEVEVVAPHRVQFVGRTGSLSDLCGEKLSERFVAAAIESASARIPVAGFAMLAPEWSSPPRYVLFAESARAQAIARLLEAHLRQSVQYDYARRLGQLGPVEGVHVVDGRERYLRGCEELGQRAGDVKPAYLRREIGWRERLVPQKRELVGT